MPVPLHPTLPPAQPGGLDSTAFVRLDFSVTTNPYGPNPLLMRAVQTADQARFPDPQYREARNALARLHGVKPASVVPGLGGPELLHRIVRGYLPQGGRALSAGAASREFTRAVQLAGGTLEPLPPAELAAALRSDVQLVYVGHPHNPTGHTYTDEVLGQLLVACQANDTLLVLDQTYAPFVGLRMPPLHSHLVTVSSPGRAHGLPGLRPAYAVAALETATALWNLAPAWLLPAATAAVLAALPQAQTHLNETLPLVDEDARELARALARVGRVEHHGTPFLTVQLPDAARVAQALLDRGLRVRECSDLGLTDTLRISVRRPEDNATLQNALLSVLGGVRS
ncbi:aminotransferase class I/II-fold pyridoxal phosphate-dependent enzyme [Deinococcus sonorensis]|uniref:histidinol-phosphate transaminase n=2 Tax=Deinococcus sonorensis TaxID=309891 RepID=A0AAU7U7I9_9DEIO